MLLCPVSAGLSWLALPATGVWPAAFVCLTPVVWGLVRSPRAIWGYLTVYCFGVVLSAVGGTWMLHNQHGYDLFYPWLAVAVIYATYFVLAALGVRYACRRKHVPVSLALPICWVAAEYLQLYPPSLGPWNLLGLCVYRAPWLIQIADFSGVYGVTFLLAAVNGAIVDGLGWRYGCAAPPRWSRRLSWGFAGGCVAFTLAYGGFRLAAPQDRGQASLEPVVALVSPSYESRGNYLDITHEALNLPVDVVALPETICGSPLNEEFRKQASPSFHVVGARRMNRLFQTAADAADKILVVGALSSEGTRTFNSAFAYLPDAEEPLRHDKVKLVAFGEYIPLAEHGGRRLSKWVGWISDPTTSLTPGREPTVFSARIRGHSLDFITPICFEDCWPDYIRAACRRGPRKAAAVFSLSGDGVFACRTEWVQHLAMGIFRAVENRVPVAKASTGISAIVDPDGRIQRQVCAEACPGGILTGRLRLDGRISPYSRLGDLFAQVCCGLWLLLVLARWLPWGRGNETEVR